MKLDLEKLRETAQNDPSFLRTLNGIADSRVRENTMSLNLIHKNAVRRSGQNIKLQETVSSMRLLENVGAGVLRDVARKDRMHFQWKVRPHSLVASILNIRVELVASDYFNRADAPAPVAPVVTLPTGWSRYRFPLRDNLEIVLDLPDDLTDHEARRLGHFLQATARLE